MAPLDEVPQDFRCAATGRPLYMPVITTGGVAYSYAAAFEMFMQAQSVPHCKVTGEPIYFLPNVCLPLHHFMMSQYRAAMRICKQQDEIDMRDKFGVTLPSLTDLPEDGEDGFLEEFQCAVSHKLASEPCCLSSGTIVCASSVPQNGFDKDPDRFVACALHGQAPRRSPALEAMIRTKFPSEYAAARGSGNDFATGTCRLFHADEHVHLGLGCDGCGLWPIRGEAWYDGDSKDKNGFHLCDACYQFGYHKRVIAGRFNQHHAPRHTMLPVPKTEF